MRITDHGHKNYVFPNRKKNKTKQANKIIFFIVIFSYARKSAKARLHIAKCIPRSLSIDDPNHSEDSRRIEW